MNDAMQDTLMRLPTEVRHRLTRWPGPGWFVMDDGHKTRRWLELHFNPGVTAPHVRLGWLPTSESAVLTVAAALAGTDYVEVSTSIATPDDVVWTVQIGAGVVRDGSTLMAAALGALEAVAASVPA